MKKKDCLGLIEIGQSPRPDSVAFVRNWMLAAGLELDILERGVLDGMSNAELEALEGPAYAPGGPSPDTRCGGFCRCPGAYQENLGAGWKEYWLPRREYNPRIQRCIEELEAAGAKTILVAVGLCYPPDAFVSHVPVVFPWKCVCNYIRALAETIPSPRIGVVNGNGRTRERDMEMWLHNGWARHIEWHFGLNNGDEAYDQSLRGKLDLAVVQYYSCLDLRNGKITPAEGYFPALERKFDCPVVSATSAALLFLRGLLRPAVDEKQFYTNL